MAIKPDPNKPITHINPPNQLPDRVVPPKPGTYDPKLPKEKPQTEPKRKPKKSP